ncbi:MAG: hypothetical protein WC943_16355 [Elusimicrobiota bacterium]|jgi:hypothetical protein
MPGLDGGLDMASFRCRYCGRFFRPDPRKRGKSKQKTCGSQACRRMHQKRKRQDWVKRHPGYDASRRLKIQGWSKAYPDYWQRYRRAHPDYVEQDNLRRWKAHRKVRCAAKQTVRRQILVEKLLAVKVQRPKTAAKQTVIARRHNALVDLLVWNEQAAKQRVIALEGPAGG